MKYPVQPTTIVPVSFLLDSYEQVGEWGTKVLEATMGLVTFGPMQDADGHIEIRFEMPLFQLVRVFPIFGVDVRDTLASYLSTRFSSPEELKANAVYLEGLFKRPLREVTIKYLTYDDGHRELWAQKVLKEQATRPIVTVWEESPVASAYLKPATGDLIDYPTMLVDMEFLTTRFAPQELAV